MKRMGMEELVEIETSNLNQSTNTNPGDNPWIKYAIVGGVIVISIGVGLYMANEFEKNRTQKFKNYGRKEDNQPNEES